MTVPTTSAASSGSTIDPVEQIPLEPEAPRTQVTESTLAALSGAPETKDEADNKHALPEAVVSDDSLEELALRLERRETTSLVILATLGVMTSLYMLKAIMLPTTIAFMLALTFRPVVRRMRRYKFPDPVSAGLILIVVFALLIAGVLYLSGPARTWLASIPTHVDILQDKLSGVIKNFKSFAEMTEQVTNIGAAEQEANPVPVAIAPSRLSSGVAFLSNTGDIVGKILLVVGLTYFFLAFGDSLLNNVLKVIDTYSMKKRTVEVIYDIEKGIASYLFLVTMINAGLGIVTGIAMWALGLPNPALWGVLAFLFNFIPVFGGLVEIVVLALVSLLTFDSLLYALLPPLVFALLMGIESNLITPPMLGRSMSLNPILVFLALIFGGWFWGIGGAFLAIPLLAAAKIAFDKYDRTRPLATLLDA